jgi:hypothetical protein
VSFGSEPGRDDGGLPPVNIVIPDDARELDRDVLAYRREQRARRRRERLMRVLRPFRGQDGPGGRSTILPLIATCVALSMLAGAMLSVVTISPASAPTVNPSAAATSADKPGAGKPLPAGLTELPSGTITLADKTEPVRTLTTAAIALIPASCACGAALRRLAAQAAAARVGLYFVGVGGGIPQVPALTAQYGGGAAATADDTWNVLGAAYRPAGLTVLLVYSDATARVVRTFPAGFHLDPTLRTLTSPGR